MCRVKWAFVSRVETQAYNNKRVSIACSSVISRLMDQFSFCKRRLLMIATFTLCSTRAFSDVLDGAVLKNFSRGKAPDPHLSSTPLPQWSFKYHKSIAYTPPVQRSLRVSC